MKKGDIPTLNQLVRTLGQLELRLEDDYVKNSADDFNNSKKVMLKIQKQISKILR